MCVWGGGGRKRKQGTQFQVFLRGLTLQVCAALHPYVKRLDRQRCLSWEAR